MKFGIVCVSDRCSKGVCEDRSGPAIEQIIKPLADEIKYMIVPDEQRDIAAALIGLADEFKADIVFDKVFDDGLSALFARECLVVSEAIIDGARRFFPFPKKQFESE